jgi:hypothetical protein
VDRKAYGDGGYAGDPTYEPRTLTVDRHRHRPHPGGPGLRLPPFLAAVQSRRGPIRYTHLDEWPAAMGLWCNPVGPQVAAEDTRVADFSFLLVAEDPIKTGAAVAYGPVRLPTVGGEGGYPMGAAGAVMPWTAAGAPRGHRRAGRQLRRRGLARRLHRHRAGPPPRIQLGNGYYVALSADLGAGDTWVVDTAAGTSTVNGVNRYDAWAAGSVFPLIPPGGVEVRLRSGSGGTDQAAGLTVLTAPSWR